MSIYFCSSSNPNLGEFIILFFGFLSLISSKSLKKLFFDAQLIPGSFPLMLIIFFLSCIWFIFILEIPSPFGFPDENIYCFSGYL